MAIKNILVGADPELFIINTKTNEVVSSIGLIPGVKGDAYRSKDMPKGYGIQIDNILGEFNIPPAKTKKEFIDSIEYMKDYIRQYVKSKNPDLDICCAASKYVPEDQLQSEEAKQFGCSTDYNVYTQSANPKPQGESTNLRSAGCHIHISYNSPNINTSLILIKYLDAFLGIPSLLIDADKDRRSLYGKAGCFRLTPYGFEYRSLSSKMIETVDNISFVWDGVMRAIKAFNCGYSIPRSSDVIRVINNSSVQDAIKLCEEFKLTI